MSLRRADARFLLSSPTRRALVLGELDGWKASLQEAGTDVLTPGGTRDTPELVVTESSGLRPALAAGAPNIIVEGRSGAKALRRAGYETKRFLSLPTVESVELLLPLDDPLPARYAIDNLLTASGATKRLRNRFVGTLVSRRAFPPIRPGLTVGQRSPDQPFLVKAAGELGVTTDVTWFVLFGRGDDHRRGVFFLFPRGSAEPRWVLKFSRVRGHRIPFDGEERGLELARAAGPAVAAGVPEALGRFEVDGIQASLEIAARGRSLLDVLDSSSGRESKLRLLDAVAGWIVELGRSTSGKYPRDEGRLAFATELVSGGAHPDLSTDLLEQLAGVDPVLAHQSLSASNIVAEGERFTVLDWEAARPDGFPLWDLLFFLTDALPHLDGALRPPSRQDDYVMRLFLGKSESSMFLFRWVRAAVEACSTPAQAVGALTTALWLGLAKGSLRPGERIPPPGSERLAGLPPAARMATLWLSTPGLGVHWDRWRG